MTDIKIENTINVQDPLPQPKPVSTPADLPAQATPKKEILIVDQEALEAKRKKSAGEVIFNRTVYTGIGFGLNEAISLYITDQFEHGKGTSIVNKLGINPKNFARAAENTKGLFKEKRIIVQGVEKIYTPIMRGQKFVMGSSLLIGGTLLVLPMRWLEDSKEFWVEKFNHLYDKFRREKLTPEEVRARDEEVAKAVACSPKQSWPTLLLGRAIAVSTTIGWNAAASAEVTPVIEDKGNTFLHWLTRNKFADKDRYPTVNRYFSLTGVETVCCTISSVVMEVASKFLASKHKQVHNPEKCEALDGIVVPVNGNGGSTSAPRESANKTAGALASRVAPRPAAKPAVNVSFSNMVAGQRKAAEEAPAQLGTT